MLIDFLERKEGREREREREINIDVRNTDWLPSVHGPTRDQTHNLGMCPIGDQSYNLLVYRLALQLCHQPGLG